VIYSLITACGDGFLCRIFVYRGWWKMRKYEKSNQDYYLNCASCISDILAIADYVPVLRRIRVIIKN
jgi:hypothetical protein